LSVDVHAGRSWSPTAVLLKSVTSTAGIAALGTLYPASAGDRPSLRASAAIWYTAFTVGAGMIVAVACALRLAMVPAGGDKLDYRQ